MHINRRHFTEAMLSSGLLFALSENGEARIHGGIPAAAPSSQPVNVLFIIMDDASMRDMLRPMANIRGTDNNQTGTFDTTLARKDVIWYPNTFSEVSQCDPSRYTCMTGVRAARHGVYDNTFDSNFSWAAGAIQTVFKTAGYRVGHIGKMDHQNLTAPVWPNFDYWVLPASNATATYYNYSTWENGVEVAYNDGSTQATEFNYFCDVLGMGLPSFVRRQDGTIVNSTTYAAMGGIVPSKFQEWLRTMDSRPWFCYVALENPHAPNDIAPRFGGTHTDNPAGQWWQGNGALLTDTPAHFAHQSNPPQWITTNCPIPTTSQQTGIRQTERGTERCMLSCDDQINLIMNAVYASYPNTMTVITSDQGIAFGEHCINAFKCDPYDPAENMISGIRYPDVTGGGPYIDTRLMSNLDYAPTICATAGVPVPRTPTDGINIRTSTRASLPIFWQGMNTNNPVPAFSGVRTLTAKYFHYTDPTTADYGFEELYDIGGVLSSPDTYEMVNQAANPTYAVLKASLLAITTP